MPAVRIAALLGIAAMTAGASAPPLLGQWGAPGANLTIGADGARLDQECGSGSFGPVQADARGHFKTSGRFEMYQPGPQRADETPGGNAAFEGTVAGDTLHLTIRPASGAAQQMTLLRGKRAKLIRCY